MSVTLRGALCAILIAASAGPAFAAAPTLIGASHDWSGYQAATGEGKVCYALSKPERMEPKGAARDPVYLIVSDWPGRKAKAEVEIIPGYPYKDGAAVTAVVGREKFQFFTQNPDNTGAAWIKNPADEQRFVQALRAGARVVVTGTSSRGTVTRDTYSLSGISAALDKVHAACGM